MVNRVDRYNFDRLIARTGRLVGLLLVVDHPVCSLAERAVERAATELAESVCFYVANVERDGEIASRLDVKAAPCLVLLLDGAERGILFGVPDVDRVKALVSATLST